MKDVKRVLSQMKRRFRRSRLVMAPLLCRKIPGYAPKASKLAKRIAGYFSEIWFAKILQYESKLFRPDFFHFKDAPNRAGRRTEGSNNRRRPPGNQLEESAGTPLPSASDPHIRTRLAA